MKKYILFDLDGTVLNSKPGIAASLNATLVELGYDQLDEATLRTFIGPPIRMNLKKVYGFTDEQADEATAMYRAKYAETGAYNSSLYPYVVEILKSLQEKGFTIALASSKAEYSCVDILRHYEIDGYFDVIGGASVDGKIAEKADVLNLVLERLGVADKSEVVLIGDTKFDVEGTKAVGIDCIGVTYGYGLRGELEKAGAKIIFDTLEEVEEYLETAWKEQWFSREFE